MSKTQIGKTDAVKLAGELNFDTAPELRRELVKKIKQKERDIVVDLEELGFMDTCGLATLIETRQKANKYGGRVVIIGVSPMIKEVMEITRVQGLFTVCDSREEAEAALHEAG